MTVPPLAPSPAHGVRAGAVCVLYGSSVVPEIVAEFARTCPTVVVDNSGDLLDGGPDVRVVSPGRNVGYSAGVNAGLAALPAGLDAVLVVNPDIVGPVSALHHLAEIVAGWDCPVLAAPEGGQLAYGFRPRAGALLVMGHYLARSDWHPTPRRPADRFLSGALLAVNAGALRVLAGDGEFLRPDLFFMDDVEITDRALAHGIAVVEVPVDGRLEHEGGTSMRRRPAVRIYFSRVSKVRYWQRRSPVRGAALRQFFRAETMLGEFLARRRDHTRRHEPATDGSAAMGFAMARQWLRTGAAGVDEAVLGNANDDASLTPRGDL